MSNPPPTDATNGTPAPPVRGYLLHLFEHRGNGQAGLCAMGKLESGETFAAFDDRYRPYFYLRAEDVPQSEGLIARDGEATPAPGWTTMAGAPVARVDCHDLRSRRRLADALAARGVPTFEADLSQATQYLLEAGVSVTVTLGGVWQPGREVDRVYRRPEIGGGDWGPRLSQLSLDIETDPEASEVFAAALVGEGADGGTAEEIHLVGSPHPQDGARIRCYPDEAGMLAAVGERIRELDPDVITGWNLIDFDLPVLRRRFEANGLPFRIGRSSEVSWFREGRVWGGSRMVVHGRQVLDALHLVRNTLWRFDDYRLETVAQVVLGRGKTLETLDDDAKAELIERTYREDRAAFAEYCLEDARLVRDILAAEGLVELTIERSLQTGLTLERAWGSIAAFDFLYIGGLHRQQIVAPTLGVDQGTGGSPGGLVLASEPGLYAHVFVMDFKSLYPSIIRTFNIDPLSLVRRKGEEADDDIEAPNGARFRRGTGILPTILESLFAGRARARERGDPLASQTFKILMNSFYGVLASNSCRFAAGELAGAITGFGQHLLTWAKERLEAEGERVLYGDTDSLFVDAGLSADTGDGQARARGDEICAMINQALSEYVEYQWRVESHLDLEFEKHYRRMLLPPMRVQGPRDEPERGRAKGYAGLLAGPDGVVDIVGMEGVRRDWTPMAQALQKEVLALLFSDAGRDVVEACVTSWTRAVRAGEKDEELVYRTALRKPVSAYTKAKPPHVKAAELLPHPRGVIRYLMTVDGPQPVGHISARIDYEHYVQKQIEPLIRTIAQVFPLDVDGALWGRLDLFSGGV